MSAPPPLEQTLARVGLGLDDVPALVHARAYSEARLDEARGCLGEHPAREGAAVSTLALGSLGRREASPSSDLDLAFVYDSRKTTRAEAEALRKVHIDALSDRFDIPQKTFRRAIDLEDLIHNVGGRRDSNDRLTYRALLLTEGAWLWDARAAASIKRAIFDVYARGEITRGRFLNSLSNDLHRYYRTVCVDYRHKVEEQAKGWAIRSLKLRHSRKLWHLANIALQLWAVDAVEDDGARDDALASRLDWPTLTRLTEAMLHFDAPKACAAAFVTYDRFLAALADPDTRAQLDRIDHAHRHDSEAYVRLRANARELDRATQALSEALWEHCREHLVRFCLL